jgi:hypothetical protein
MARAAKLGLAVPTQLPARIEGAASRERIPCLAGVLVGCFYCIGGLGCLLLAHRAGGRLPQPGQGRAGASSDQRFPWLTADTRGNMSARAHRLMRADY